MFNNPRRALLTSPFLPATNSACHNYHDDNILLSYISAVATMLP